MNQFQQAVVMMSIIDSHWGARDATGRRREFTPEELDALAGWSWHWPDLKGVMTAWANAMRLRWRPRVSDRIAPTSLASAEATAQV